MASERKSKFNISPYYDDFDEAKKFLRVLFRPSYSVQARELTQLQTILNNQIGRMGDHLFENGDVVRGAGVSESRVEYVRLEESATVNASDLLNYDITLEQDGKTRRGKVIAVEEKTSTDPHIILFYEPLSGRGNTTIRQSAGVTQETRKSTLFIGGDQLSTSNPNIDPGAAGITVKEATANPDGDPSSTNIPSQGEALLVTVDEGIFYTEGFFVLGTKQSHAVFKTTDGIRDYRVDPLTAVVGFGIQREIVTASSDSTLLDPAQGSYNYNAPGGDRYKIDLIVKQIEFAFNELGYRTEFDTENFIEFFRVLDGKTFKTLKYSEYARLEDTLARRTYDESGHYSVDMFPIDKKEYKDVFDPSLSPSPDIQTNPISYWAMGLGAGKAYVKGYEFESQATEYIIGRKARFDDHILQQDEKLIYNNIGNYVLIQNNATNPVFGGSTGFFADNPATSIFGPRQMKLQLRDATNIQIGCANAVHIQPDNAEKTLYRLYLSDIVFGEKAGLGSDYNERTIEEVITFAANEVYDPNDDSGTTQGSVKLFHADINSVTGGSNLYDPGNMSLIYPLPVGDHIKTVRGLDYYVQRDYVATLNGSAKATFGNGNNTTLNQNPNSELVFQGLNNSDGFIDDIDALDDYIVVHEGTVYDPGSASSGITISAQSGNKTVEIELPAGSSGQVYLLANQRVEDSTGVISNGNYREKRLKEGTVVIKGSGGDPGTESGVFTNAIGAGYGLNLETSDVFMLLEVTDNTAEVDSDEADVTKLFSLNNGQKQHLYDHAFITIDQSYANGRNGPADRWKNNGQGDNLFTVRFLYFDQLEDESSYNTIAFPIIADSYYGHGNHVAGLTFDGIPGLTFDYEHIPTFQNERTGETIRLRDAIDHRPIRAPGENGAGSQSIPVQERGKVFGAYTPEDGELYFSYYDHYIGRKDKVLLNKDRKFRIVEGVPAMMPKEPDYDKEDNLCLYTLTIPPYTNYAEDIEAVACDFKRYTMEDIGQIDRRLNDVEQQTKLNTSEIVSLQKSVQKVEATTEFLVGLLNDPLDDHEGADTTDEHNCAIGDGVIEPVGSDACINLEVVSRDDGITYDTFTRIAQLTPSTQHKHTVVSTDGNIPIQINPSGKTTYIGFCELSPKRDSFVDQTRAPKIKNGRSGFYLWAQRNVRRHKGLTNGFGAHPGSGWIGQAWYKKYFTIWNKQGGAAAMRYARGIDPYSRFSNNELSKLNPFTPNKYLMQFDNLPLQEQHKHPKGYGKFWNKAMNYIPPKKPPSPTVDFRLRKRKITFRAKGLKPNTRLYGYFDGNALGGPGNNLALGTHTDVYDRTTGSAEANRLKEVGTITGNTPGVSGTELYSNEQGECHGTFTISEFGASVAGTKVFRLTDVDPTESMTTATTASEALYDVSSAKRGKVYGSKKGLFRRSSPKSERNPSTQSLSSGTYSDPASGVDPLTQTFTVDQEEYPTGILLSSVDLWFKFKDPNIPVRMEIRPIKNGAPDPDHVMEGCDVGLTGGDISTNNNGVAVEDYTRFTLSSPSRLDPGEYGICVISNTNADELWGGIVGDKGITGDGTQTVNEIAKQPYVNKFYLTQNNGVRETDATKSILFRVNRSTFQTSETKSFRVAGMTGEGITGGTTVVNTEDQQVVTPDCNKILLMSSDVADPGEVMTYTLLSDSGVAPQDAKVIEPNEEMYLSKKATLAVDDTTPILQITMGTNDENTTPQLDLDDLNLIATKYNMSDDTTGELDPTAPESDKGKCKYLARRTVLPNPADDIHVEFDGQLPQNTDAKIYVKLLPEGESDFRSKGYVELEKDSETKILTTSAGEYAGAEATSNYKRYRYVAPTGTTIPKYRVFSTKVLLTGNENAENVPRIKNLSSQAVVKGVTSGTEG